MKVGGWDDEEGEKISGNKREERGERVRFFEFEQRGDFFFYLRSACFFLFLSAYFLYFF